MQKATAKAIMAASEETGIEARLHATYSGRGMMGRSTHAISTNNLGDLLKLVSIAAVRVKETEEEGGDEDVEQTHEAFTEDLDLKSDNLGSDLVVY